MRVVILPDSDAVAQRGADLVSAQLNQKPGSVLGLATGGTPVSLYAELVSRYQKGELSFRKCKTFNLDEYAGLPPSHPQSYRAYMDHHLFCQIDIQRDETCLPAGDAVNLSSECEIYEKNIKAAGGIDLQILGLGVNGHIGFNEPGSSLGSRTRLKTLTRETLDANSRFFNADEFQPDCALTMGIGTILEAKKIVMLATGVSKAKAVQRAVEGPVMARCPASVLQMHPQVTLILDHASASQLEDKEYYLHSESIQQQIVA